MKRVKLSDAFDLQMGKTPSRKHLAYWRGGTEPWISIADLSNCGKYIEQTKENITSDAVRESNIKIVPKNTVVMSFKLSIGKAAITKRDMYTNEAIMAFHDRGRYEILTDYLYYFCKGNNWTSGTNKAVMGLTLNKKTLSEQTMLLPDMPEQEKIVKKLDALQESISNRQRVLMLLDELVRSRFVEMFGDPGINPHKWPLVSLGNLGELNRGVSKHRPRNDPSLLNGKYPLIQTGDVAAANLYIRQYHATYSEIGLQQSRMWPKGTLCITIAANIAKTGILDFDACFPDSVVGFIPDKINVLYMHFWFSFFQKIIEEQAPQSAQKNINLKILHSMQVGVPPLKLQTQFATFVHQVDATKSSVQSQLDSLTTLRAKMMQDFFG